MPYYYTYDEEEKDFRIFFLQTKAVDPISLYRCFICAAAARQSVSIVETLNSLQLSIESLNKSWSTLTELHDIITQMQEDV